MPNKKTKKFDFQILLAVLMILLAICCAVVCIFADNTENGVANAYTSEEIGVTNLQFSVNDGFYFKNLTFEQLKNVVSYLSYYYAGLFDFSNNISVQSTAGYIQMSYNNTMTSEKVPLDFQYAQYSLGEYQIMTFQILLGGYDTEFFKYDCNFATGEIAFDSTYPYINNAGDYYFDFTGNIQSTGTFANKLVSAILGANKVSTVSSIDSLSFTFNNTSNLGCLFSASNTFATPPVVLPQSVYDGLGDSTELQNQITELQDEITRLTSIIESKDKTIDYYEALMPQTETVAVFDISKCVPSTFVYNGITYSSDTIEAIDGGGWNVYDSRYKDKQLPNNHSVGFSLLLTETLNNIKIRFNSSIQPWYSYRYSVTGDDGVIQWYDVLNKHFGFSVGYRNQNGQIVKLGEVEVDLVGNYEFIINQPTNEIVFFASECNRLEVGKGMGVYYYKVNTQVLYDEAYAEGYKTGYGYGKYIGKNEGIEQASDYSFFSLFSAVFDAPITAIVGRWGDSDGDGVYEREGGLLNFYIPGLDINFAPFLLSIFTLAIIVMIIRFILARKS